jgi:hypothetical protein
MKELSSMSEAVRQVISGYPHGHRYHGNELKADVVAVYPKAANTYVDTIQRMMRRFCSAQYRTVNQNKSLYEKL